MNLISRRENQNSRESSFDVSSFSLLPNLQSFPNTGRGFIQYLWMGEQSTFYNVTLPVFFQARQVDEEKCVPTN